MNSDNTEPDSSISDPAFDSDAEVNQETPRLNISKRPILRHPSLSGEPKEDTNESSVDPLAEQASNQPKPPTKDTSIVPDLTSHSSLKKPAMEPEPETSANPDDLPTKSDIPEQGSKDKSATPVSKDANPPLEDTNRLQQIQQYMKARTFFVPINSVAQKKSVKRSAKLLIVMIILSLILIDLMLDSGAILFVQKLPHTHFFSVHK